MAPRDRGRNIFQRSVYLAWLLGACALAADSPLAPVTVCEILKDLPIHEGKEVAVLGRYSFRQSGRWIAEQACDPASPAQPLLWLINTRRKRICGFCRRFGIFLSAPQSRAP